MLISSGKAILMRLVKHMILARNEKPSITPPARHPRVAGIFLAGLISALPPALSPAHAQDVFSSGGSSEWDNAPVRGTGNVCQQAERWIEGRWATWANGSCVGDDRSVPTSRSASVKSNGGNSSDPIVRPPGVQPFGSNNSDPIVRPPDVSPPAPVRRSNGRLGLTQEQKARLQAQDDRINGSRDASIFNGLAKEKGIPAYQAGPQDSNVGQNFGFGQSGKSRKKNFAGYAGRGTVSNKAGNGTSYGRNYGGVQY